MDALYQKMKDFILNRLGILRLLFAFSFLIFVIRELVKIAYFDVISPSSISSNVTSLGVTSFIILIILGVIAILPMIIYDFAVVKFLGKKLNFWTIIKNGFIVNVFTNIFNYHNIVGAGLRAKLYSEDADSDEVSKTLHKSGVFLPAGLAIFSLLTLILIVSGHGTPFLNHYWIWFMGYLLYFPIRLMLTKKRNTDEFRDVTIKRSLELCLASTLKWASNLALFLIIGYFIMGHISGIAPGITQIIIIFVLANIVAHFSLLPAGIGSFDFILILELTSLGMPISLVIAWDLVYRLVYYVIPVIIALTMFGLNYGQRFNDYLDGIPGSVIQKLAQLIVTVFLYFSGIMLLILATVPNFVSNNQFFLSLEPYTFYFLSQLSTIIVAFILIGLARGVSSKVKRSFWPTVIVLLIAMGNTIWKENFPVRMCIIFGFILLCLWISRGILYRNQLSYSWGQIIMDIIIFTITFIVYTTVGLYNFISNGNIHFHHLNNVYLFPSQQVWLSGFIGLIAACLILVLIYRYFSAHKVVWLDQPFDSSRVRNVINEFGGNDVSHLAFVRDKHIYFYTEDGKDQLFFMYKHIANKLVVMGEPVGNQDKLSEAIDEFMMNADQEGLSLVFYEVGEQFTMMLHEKGFDFTKVGEEGLVDLSKFTLVGKKHRGERALIHKFERDNFKFSIVKPPFSNEFISELKQISDQWLHGNPEKGFSLGYFDNYYLQQAPIAIMQDENGNVMAFANLMPTGDHSITSIDLMRSDNKAPSGIMDGIFINLFKDSLNEGYKYFNLGMAPLSNVGESKFSFIDEKIVNLIYQYGQVFYSFQGLRSYKNKYVNLWVPRYIAYRRKSSQIFTILQILIIVNKKVTNKEKHNFGLFSWLFTNND